MLTIKRVTKLQGSVAEQQVNPGSSFQIQPYTEYALIFSEPPSERIAQQLNEIGAHFIDSQTFILSIVDFMGEFSIGPYNFNIVSSKISSREHSQMLDSVASLASQLLFAWNSPIQTSTTRVEGIDGRVAFLDLLYLRSIFFPKKGEIGLKDAFRIISAQPVRKAVQRNIKATIQNVSSVSSRTFQSIITNPNTWEKTSSSNRASTLPIARFLSVNGEHYIPAYVTVSQPEYTLDTHENQFVKRFLIDCRSLVSKFSQKKDLRKTLLDDLREMLSIIDEILNSSFFYNVHALKGPLRVSQALLKSPGYMRVFETYRGLNSLKSTNAQEKELSFLSDGRDLPKLYEYWVFTEVTKAIASRAGPPVSFTAIESDDQAALIPRGSIVRFQNGVEVIYDLHFRGKSAVDSYSLSLRPDVVIKIGSDIHVIDAKFKADFTKLRIDAEQETFERSYKSADIYKMHTYRDALHSVKSCWVAYPGDRNVFFSINGNQYSLDESFELDGVGAIGLSPGAASNALLEIVNKILRST